jgi:hypothetical protein
MKPHRFDALSFIAGLVATGIGLLFLLPAEPGAIFDVLGDVGSWFWPILLLTMGTAILLPPLLKRGDDSEDL